MWRWAHGSDKSLIGIGAALEDAVCAECVNKTYFHLPNANNRLNTFIHKWRVANYVSAPDNLADSGETI